MADLAAVPTWAESERLEALTQLSILDTPPEQAFDDIVALARLLCDAPIALVSLVDRDRQWFKAKAGTDVAQTALNTSVCAFAIRQRGLFVIPDLVADERTRAFSLVTEPPHMRFYAGMPLITAHGLPIGSLCVIDAVPRPDGLTPAQGEGLQALARLAMSRIELGAAIDKREVALSASNSIGTWDWDIELDLVTADRRFSELYGVDPAVGTRGAPIKTFFARVHSQDLPRLQAAIESAQATGDPFSTEYRLIQPDGSIRWVAAQGRCALAEDGRPLRFPGVSFDITPRKQIEARQAALLEFGDRIRNEGDPVEIAYIAAEILARTLEISRAGYGLIDTVAETITIDRDWNAPGVPSIAGMLRFREHGSYIEDLKRGETVVCADADHDPRTRDTAAALKAITAHAFVNMPITEQGRFVALLFLTQGAPRDWTADELVFAREVAERTRSAVERRRAEQELATLTASLETQIETRTRELMEAEEQLRQAQKMEAVGQLTGGLAHDFNNMLAGIVGSLELMQVRLTQGRTADIERYIYAAQGAARRAAALTHRLLAFSRRQTLDPKPTDINRLVQGMEDLIRRTVGPATTVEVVAAGGLWQTFVDQGQLENALLNLCINARDAMPHGGKIIVETANRWLDERAARERDLAPGQYVSLCVSDNGTGMPPDVIAKAFDPFFTTKPLGQGTGLGLSMIYGFARQSAGQVRIYSEIGAGTNVCVYLPRHGDDTTLPEPVKAGARIDQSGRADGETVLVVDDEATVRMLVIEVLEELGYHTLEASDGAAGLRLIQATPQIDLLITDVGLPGGMNGRQLADAAREQRDDLKILFITGYAENAALSHGHLGTGMHVLTKPFAMDALATRVKELIAAD